MPYNSRCGCGCSSPCGSTPCTSCGQKCKEITTADIAVLEYIAGYDENGCKKVALPETLLGLIDCEGEEVTRDTPIVTCDTLDVALCEVLGDMAPAGAAVPNVTQLVGADCSTYTLPAGPTAVTVADTTSLNLEISGSNVISGNVNISEDAGNIIELRVDGLYADIDAADLCAALSDIEVGATAVAGDMLVGADCELHAFPAFQSPLSVTDTSTVDHTLAGGNVLSSVVRISATAGNIITANADGLYADAADAVTVSDTSTLDLTLAGSNISGVVRVSATAGNDIEVNADGLYLDVCDTLNAMGSVSVAVPGSTILAGADCNRYTLPTASNLSVLDTTTVNHTLTGGTVLSSDVNVSAVAGNLLQVRVDGLAVLPSTTGVQISAVDSNCLNLTVTESPDDNFTITGNPIISPDAGNQLECTANGLYVPPVDVTLSCAAIQAIFDDSGANITSGQNILVDDCNTYTFPDMLPLDTNTIDMSVTNDVANNFVYSANVRLDPAAANGLTSSASGLLAPPNVTGNLGAIDGGLLLNSVDPVADGASFSTVPLTLNISNPSAYRSAILTIYLNIPATQFVPAAGTEAGNFLEMTLSHSFNLPGVLVTGTTVFTNFSVNGNNTNESGSPPAERTFTFLVPPSFVGSYTFSALAVFEGGADVASIGVVGSKYTLVTV